MNRLARFTFGLAILVLWAGHAAAADKWVPQEGALELLLLRQPSVQKELKLTEAVTEKVHKYCMQQWDKAQKAGSLNESEQDKEFTKLAKENEQFVAETLTKEQAKRLHQITLQNAGLLCVTRKEIASKLKLTEEQKKQLPKLHKEAHHEVEELLYVTSKEQRREKLQELRETNRKRLLDLLTDEQEVVWKEMIGSPFTGDLSVADVDTSDK